MTDNPNAFPLDASAAGFPPDFGMSLRDWFAGQALISMGTWMPVSSNAQLTDPETLRQRALWAYQQADAMIAARKELKDD